MMKCIINAAHHLTALDMRLTLSSQLSKLYIKVLIALGKMQYSPQLPMLSQSPQFFFPYNLCLIFEEMVYFFFSTLFQVKLI